ncbi:MAG TPA: ADP/ATP-dependent (S)-NAD(P)H-hydrate dehydratase, partial [Candidatus Saccharimonadales bacterium]|nr:ADP/ATP-dependent (S)-NAD(P)H-hydrate dehydratase [Candidatus Saccharimonadales bacterium]
ANAAIVATPHDGEFKKLTDQTLPHDAPARMLAARSFARSMHVTLVCKGSHTIVGHPDGSAYQEQRGNPGLATAGAGDVLAGVIGGLLAQGVSVKDAAELGVHLHAVAGDLAAVAKTEPGVVASDIIDALPQALRGESVK